MWSWDRLHHGRPDFARPSGPMRDAYEHDDIVDVSPDYALPDDALPLNYRWGAPLSWSCNHHHMCCHSIGINCILKDMIRWNINAQVLWGIYIRFVCMSSVYMFGWLRDLANYVTSYSFWYYWVAQTREGITSVWFALGDTPICSVFVDLWYVDRRGQHQYDWMTFHARYISLWASRSKHNVAAPLAPMVMDFKDPYMQWYRGITRRFSHPF